MYFTLSSRQSNYVKLICTSQISQLTHNLNLPFNSLNSISKIPKFNTQNSNDHSSHNSTSRISTIQFTITLQLSQSSQLFFTIIQLLVFTISNHIHFISNLIFTQILMFNSQSSKYNHSGKIPIFQIAHS